MTENVRSLARLCVTALLLATVPAACDSEDRVPAVAAAPPAAGEGLARAQPPEPLAQQYRQLGDALGRYRAIAATGGWAPIPDGGEVLLDGSDPRVSALRRRLAAEGDLASGENADDPGALREAVRGFQSRHGLEPDARVGPKTLAELNTPVAARIAQIAVNLERLRRLPSDLGQRHIAVNVADAMLELIEHGRPALRMRVIVGDRRHPTPEFAASIAGITFNPPWNVPPSIAVREILPRLRRDPGYLAAHKMTIVGREDDPHGARIDWRQVGARNFPYRFRQLPGASNSLGRIKFEMPNAFDVYLHDTPAKALFKRAERGLSHGCVRLERPEELALRLLDHPAWDADALMQAVAAGQTRYVALDRPIPVYFLYWTAFVDGSGRMNFRRDIYDRDSLSAAGMAPPQGTGCGDAEPAPPRK